MRLCVGCKKLKFGERVGRKKKKLTTNNQQSTVKQKEREKKFINSYLTTFNILITYTIISFVSPFVFCYIMSLTSKELNYLIWRYLQESGYDLSAYALDQQSQCSEYENNPTTQELIQKIKPGCLVDLIQKGILYMAAEQEATDSTTNLSLYGALIQDDLNNLKDNNNISNGSNGSRFALKSEIETNGEQKDSEKQTNNDKDNQDIEMTDALNKEAQQQEIIEFETQLLSPQLKFAPSLTCDWHPTTEVFAYGKDDGTATINAIQDGKIIETRTLTHPNLLNIKNQINIVSWSPQGSLIITCGANSELRAWSPDGKLKNIASTIVDEAISLENTKLISIISSLSWSPTGKFLLSIDSLNQVCIWDGTTISLIKQIKNLEINDDSVVCSCWLSEDKFAVTTNTNGIKIYDILQPPSSHFGNQLDVQPIGLLNGHEHNISLMKLNPVTKLLATCSDFDYSIKVWSSSSSQECLDLNINPEKKYTLKLHAAPMIGLIWLPDSNSNERNLLLSVSMEGILNIWDAKTSENIKSSELFNNKDNFTNELKDDDNNNNNDTTIKDVLVFNAVLSPDGKYLALGDDYCRVTIWDVDTTHYLNEPKDLIRCKAVYKPEISAEDKLKATIGICDMKWDHESKLICVSYNGMESVIINTT